MAAAAAYGVGGMAAPTVPVLLLLIGLFAAGAVTSLRRASRGPAASLTSWLSTLPASGLAGALAGGLLRVVA